MSGPFTLVPSGWLVAVTLQLASGKRNRAGSRSSSTALCGPSSKPRFQLLVSCTLASLQNYDCLRFKNKTKQVMCV